MRDRNRPTTTRIRSPVRSTRRARWKAKYVRLTSECRPSRNSRPSAAMATSSRIISLPATAQLASHASNRPSHSANGGKHRAADFSGFCPAAERMPCAALRWSVRPAPPSAPGGRLPGLRGQPSRSESEKKRCQPHRQQHRPKRGPQILEDHRHNRGAGPPRFRTGTTVPPVRICPWRRREETSAAGAGQRHPCGEGGLHQVQENAAAAGWWPTALSVNQQFRHPAAQRSLDREFCKRAAQERQPRNRQGKTVPAPPSRSPGYPARTSAQRRHPGTARPSQNRDEGHRARAASQQRHPCPRREPTTRSLAITMPICYRGIGHQRLRVGLAVSPTTIPPSSRRGRR